MCGRVNAAPGPGPEPRVTAARNHRTIGMKYVIPFMFLAILAPPAQARPVLLELFTSQSCSSCPPAEALLANLKSTRADVNVLEFHVDYWNALNWHDPYSSRAATNRQRAYAAALATEVFTPQLVIDGHRSEIGSDQASVAAAIATAQHAQAAGPPLSVSRTGAGIAVSVGPGSGAMPEAAHIAACRLRSIAHHRNPIGRKWRFRADRSQRGAQPATNRDLAGRADRLDGSPATRCAFRGHPSGCQRHHPGLGFSGTLMRQASEPPAVMAEMSNCQGAGFRGA